MRELNVYYCPKCGRYAYHHIPKNAVCPTCSISMTLLNVIYQSFMQTRSSVILFQKAPSFSALPLMLRPAASE